MMPLVVSKLTTLLRDAIKGYKSDDMYTEILLADGIDRTCAVGIVLKF